MNASSQDVTRLLADWRNGDRAALDELTPLVYDEMHRLASRARRGERPGHTLQTTALVHEAWVRLAGAEAVAWHDRVHFFAVAAQIMRRLLVDYARRRRAAKRGRDTVWVSLDEAAPVSEDKDHELLAVDEALARLGALDERKSRIVELRYFAGLSVEETAKALDISTRTVKREWLRARAWIYRELGQEKPDEA